jgi:DeoR/GlpR family transcriptional regulator of sugar metabolism
VLLADSSKFDYSALMMLAPPSRVRIPVVRDDIADSARRAVDEAGAEHATALLRVDGAG